MLQTQPTTNSQALQLSTRGFFFKYENYPQFKELYDKYYSQDTNVKCWDFRRQVIKASKELFSSDISYWLDNQIKHNYLCDRRLEFLLDTLTFIRTGKRKMCLDNWYELLEDDPVCETRKITHTQIETLKELSKGLTTNVELIIKWCSQQKGFEDMICTLEILFGGPSDTSKAEKRGEEHLTMWRKETL